MYRKDCRGWENLTWITERSLQLFVLFQTKTSLICLPCCTLNQGNEYPIWFRFDIFREKYPVLDENGTFLHPASDVT